MSNEIGFWLWFGGQISLTISIFYFWRSHTKWFIEDHDYTSTGGYQTYSSKFAPFLDLLFVDMICAETGEKKPFGVWMHYASVFIWCLWLAVGVYLGKIK